MLGVMIIERCERMDRKEVKEEYERRACKRLHEARITERGQLLMICLVYLRMS